MTLRTRRTTTHIISADGTHFVPEAQALRRRRKVIGITCAILASPFMIAAAVGIYLAATEGIPAPKATNDTATFNDGWDTGLADILDIAHEDPERVNACLANSKGASALHTCLTRDSRPAATALILALKACEEVPDNAREACIALYLRPAYDLDMGENGASHTPAGPALVKECTDQYTDRDELTMCLSQGIAGDN